MHTHQITRSTFITLISIVIVGVLSRTVLHVAPNFELITGLTLLSATRLPKQLSWLAPLAMLLISDFIIGNSAIFLFTWSGFAVTYVIGRLSSEKLTGSRFLKRIIGYELLAIASVAFFYFWTNFGVVLTSTMYVHNLVGYGQSLIMALPFLKTQIISVALTTPIIVVVYEVATGYLKANLASVKKLIA